MDIKNAEDKLNQVDSLLTTLTKVIKKHWLILIIIVSGILIYSGWEFVLNDDADPTQIEAPVDEEIVEEETFGEEVLNESTQEEGVEESY